MSDPIPIFSREQPFFLPAFELTALDGDRLPRDVIKDVMSVTYDDNLGLSDAFSLTINNWDAKRRRPKYFGYAAQPSGGDERRWAKTFEPGNEFRLKLGYRGREQLRLMLVGYVARIDATYPQAGAMTLRVSGFDLLKKFQQQRFSKTWRNKKDSQVARALAADPTDTTPGIGMRVEPSPDAEDRESPVDTIRMRNQSPIDFLNARARLRGYVVQIRYDGDQPFVYFGPAQAASDQTVYRLTWGKSLLEFHAALNANRVRSVTVRGWNPRTGRVVQARASLRDTPFNRDLHQFVGRVGRDEVITDQVITTEGQARALAQDVIRRHASGIASARGATVGLPDLRAGRSIVIEGTDYRFNGRYRLTKTTHTIDTNGYRTSFDAEREAALGER